MKKIVLMGRSEAGKTTLTQALRGEKIHYQKTQYVNHFDVVVDTPGEYAQTKWLAHALALYTYEAQVVGLLVSATESYCLFQLTSKFHFIFLSRTFQKFCQLSFRLNLRH